jgi:hypothetical protein
LYMSLNFGGTIDWAIDLNEFMPGDSEVSTSRGFRGRPSMRGAGQSPLVTAEMMQSCVDDPSWKEVKCTHPMIEQPSSPPEQRWRELKVDAAWCAAITDWKTKWAVLNNSGISFPAKVADFLKDKRSFWCDRIDADNLCVVGRCTNDGTGAGTQLTMESFQNIHLVRFELFLKIIL